jgi:2-succinyl-6-hydroxy-2,4-cyclohexadiene-1-carboxylate synthase
MEMPSPHNKNGSITCIAVNGVQMGLVQCGTATDTTQQNPLLVLIHGFTGSTENWAAHIQTFTHWGFHIIALDMLGHGRSSIPSDAQRYSIEHSQADIIAALQALGVGPGEAILLGYSMGGRIALYTALSGFFRALILESATPGLSTEQEREQRRRCDEALASCIEQYGIEAFVDYWERRPLFVTQLALSLETRRALRQQRLKNDPLGLANSLRGVGTGAQPDLRNRLSTLQLPVLLITGAEDQKFTTLAEEMLPLLPQGRHVVVPGAGHTVHLEQPEAFASTVRNFCQSLA